MTKKLRLHEKATHNKRGSDGWCQKVSITFTDGFPILEVREFVIGFLYSELLTFLNQWQQQWAIDKLFYSFDRLFLSIWQRRKINSLTGPKSSNSINCSLIDEEFDNICKHQEHLYVSNRIKYHISLEFWNNWYAILQATELN